MVEEKNQEGRVDLEAIMEVYRKLAVPGAPHEMLASRAGSWETRNTYWADPDQPPMESKGSAERRMILGGRYLQEEFTGEMMGSPFAGIGFTAYDNHAKKYAMVWMDTFSTGIYVSEGTAGEEDRTILFHGHFDDPVKGPVTMRGMVKMIDDDQEVFEMQMTDKNGHVEKCETFYTRKR